MTRRKTLDVSPEKYQEVITYLEQGGTKKAACEMLGIAYNTKRLGQLLEDFVDGQERDKRLRKEKRKQALTNSELVGMITDYLSGESLSELSDRYYRSINYIKYHLEKHGAMLRSYEKIDELNPPILPDLTFREDFEVGEYVWSAKYGSPAKVCAKYKDSYRILVQNERERHYAYQPYWELGSLQHLKDLGVNISALKGQMMSDDEIMMEINEALRKANKRG